jgi:hypothetical protein
MKPIVEAENAELRLMEEIGLLIQEAMEHIPKEKRKLVRETKFTRLRERLGLFASDESRVRRYKLPGIPWVASKEELLMLALNLGNEYNRQRLLLADWNTADYKAEHKGDPNYQPLRISEEGLNNVTAALSKEEWQFVIGVWRAIDKLWQPLSDMHFKATGINLSKVEPIMVQTPLGEVEGGYFPVVYDPKMSDMAQTNEEKKQLKDLMAEMGMVIPSTQAGATHERVGGMGPLLLNLSVLDYHLSGVIHDITHRLAVERVQRIIADQRFRTMVNQRLGKGGAKVFDGWLAFVAARNNTQLQGLSGIIAAIRKNVTVAILGFKASTGLMQLTGIFQSMEARGFKYIKRGVFEVIHGGQARIEERKRLSPSLKQRNIGYERDFREKMRGGASSTLGGVSFSTHAARAAFTHIVKMDMGVALVTWEGARLKGLDEGMDEATAVAYADKILRETQPMSAAKDTSAIQRGNELEKIFSMFYTIFNGFHNRNVKMLALYRNKQISGVALARLFLLTTVLPATIEFLIVNQGIPDDEDEWKALGAGIISYTAAGIPVVRDIVSALVMKWMLDRNYGYTASPVIQTIENLSDSVGIIGDSLFDDGEVKENQIKRAVRAVGYLAGIPGTNQALTTLEGLENFDMDELGRSVANLLQRDARR